MYVVAPQTCSTLNGFFSFSPAVGTPCSSRGVLKSLGERAPNFLRIPGLEPSTCKSKMAKVAFEHARWKPSCFT